MNPEHVAKVCHQANKAYCESMDDNSQVDWEKAPEWQRLSAINGVKFVIDNPNTTPEQLHENWCIEKRKDGWKYGSIKNAEKKEHNCLIEYNQLPVAQRVKDGLFHLVAKVCLDAK